MNHKKLLGVVVLVVVLVLNSCQKGSDLVLYSPHKENLIDLVVDMYEAETGTNIEIITAGTGELIARLKTEAKNPNADVIWGGSMNTLLPESDYFETYRSPLEKNVFEEFKNTSGKVTQFSAIPSTIIVNTKELAKLCGADARIEGYESIIALAKTCPDLRGRISNADPSKSSSSFEQLINQLWAYAYIIAEEQLGRTAVTADITQAHLDQSWSRVVRLVDVYDGKHAAGSGAVITDVVQGETAVGLSYEMASAQAADNSDDVIIVYPKEGSVVKADGAAIIKGAKNMKEAKKFIDFLLSAKIQNSIKVVYRRPIMKGADFSGSPLAPLEQFKLIEDKGDLNNKAQFLSKYSEIFR